MPPDAAERAEVARRRARAIELRVSGWTWQAIADELGYSDKGAACKDVSRAMEAAREEMAETAEALRAFELERLDVLQRAATAVLEREHLTVSHGRVVRVGKPVIRDGEAVIEAGAGEPLLDDGPTLAAIDRLVKIAESRRKLLGLDAPTKLDATLNATPMHVSYSINLDGMERTDG